ncbi:transglutaminase family protein [Patescibacteria group bacterium]|nr:transglutaminase family protein [Patescibacteria group bacterium]MCL5091907.1 transglutaminase family protein [Patescibacteria group bacterium]
MTGRRFFCWQLKPNVKGQLIVWPLPQSNHYQTIARLHYPTDTHCYKDRDWNNHFLVTSTNQTRISFYYRPRAVNRQIDPRWTRASYPRSLVKPSRHLLQPNRFINGQDPDLIRLRTKLVREKSTGLAAVITACYRGVIEYLAYGRPTTGLYSYRQALRGKTTDCGGFSTLLLSLLQSLKIPGRLVVGFLIKKPTLLDRSLKALYLRHSTLADLSMHAWAEALLPDGDWFPLDPALEWKRNRGLTKRDGGFGRIPADRLTTSYGQDFGLKIKNRHYTIDLLQCPVILNTYQHNSKYHLFS